jgi:cytochrome c-type biogenesis protein CcmE
MAMTRKQKRLSLIAAAGAVLAIAAGLILFALSDKIVFFYTPSDMTKQRIAAGTRVRIGGLIEMGSVKRDAAMNVEFRITDTEKTLTVHYKGLLPDLFREGQGVVAEGVYQGSDMVLADTVLAKHDENYMPKDVADALKKKGVWQGGKGQ